METVLDTVVDDMPIAAFDLFSSPMRANIAAFPNIEEVIALPELPTEETKIEVKAPAEASAACLRSDHASAYPSRSA